MFMFKKKIAKLPELKFAKVRDVKNPSVAYVDANSKSSSFVYGNASAGIDFYVPDVIPIQYIKEKNLASIDKIAFLPAKNTLLLEPMGRVLIPSGIKANIPDGYMLMGADKSGVAVNKGLIVAAKIIDSDFLGEIHLHVVNTSEKTVEIGGGDKLVQFIVIALPKLEVSIVDIDELYQNKITSRGEGGFGSSGK